MILNMLSERRVHLSPGLYRLQKARPTAGISVQGQLSRRNNNTHINWIVCSTVIASQATG